jgi:predicted nucleotidyltransferase component of viral defense system
MASIAELTAQQQQHIKIMTAIAQSVANTPLILKGGTALLLAYSLDRFSEDLDFDCHKNLRLEHKIQEALSYSFKLQSLDLLKDTDTVTRYRLIYDSCVSKNNRLKIEISHRVEREPISQIMNGIKVYKLPELIHQKLLALEGRTAARDLYDINFLAKNYKDSFSKGDHKKLKILLSDINTLESRFNPAFKDDEILYQANVSQIIVSLTEVINGQEWKLGKSRHR